jgi:hypothetical protein
MTMIRPDWARISWRENPDRPVDQIATLTLYGGPTAESHDVLVQFDVPVVEERAPRFIGWYGPKRLEIFLEPKEADVWLTLFTSSPARRLVDAFDGFFPIVLPQTEWPFCLHIGYTLTILVPELIMSLS